MRNIIKKYYKLDDETKDMLEALYMFNELETTAEDFEDVGIYNIRDKEIFLDIAMNCTYLTNLGPDKIVKRLLEILSCRDITLDNINELDTDELIELMEIEDEDDTIKEDLEIVNQFIYNGFFCLLLKDNNKYILITEKNNNSKVITFNNIEQLLSIIGNIDNFSENES